MAESTKEVVGHLTAKEARAFKLNAACTGACKRLVKEAVKHFEMAEIELSELWDATFAKYGLKHDPGHYYTIEYGTNAIVKIKASGEKTKSVMDSFDAREAIHQETRKKFGLEDEE